jgi:hypothetical protein
MAKCESCRFCFTRIFTEDCSFNVKMGSGVGVATRKKGDKDYYCRRYAPRLASDSLGVEVAECYWCGEFAEIE